MSLSNEPIKAWLPVLTIVSITALVCFRILLAPYQFIINDLGPFDGRMLTACLSPYEFAGLGRNNPYTIPSHCDYGALSLAIGGGLAQHLFLVGAVAGAGLGMFFLLRRLGNPTALCLFGAFLYELSPAIFDFQNSGPGLLLTVALLPAILVGAVPKAGTSPVVEGARSGAIAALLTYANTQAPALIALLVLPVLVVLVAGDRRRYVLVFGPCFVGTFLLCAIPALQILPSYGAATQASHLAILDDLISRLARDNVLGFLAPYLFIGAIPALVGTVLVVLRSEVKPAERGLAATSIIAVVLWDILEAFGTGITGILPPLALFKDFIKLQIVFAIPVVVLSIMVLRWLVAYRFERKSLARSAALLAAVAVILLPQLWLRGGALVSGRLGLPEWAAVPKSYEEVLKGISAYDPGTSNYRVLWVPVDWRLWLSFRSLEPNALLYHEDSSEAVRKAVLQSYEAVVDSDTEQIAPLLGSQAVKYVVLDKFDGQDRNSEPWQRGEPKIAAVWGTRALAGAVLGYLQTFAASRGLQEIKSTSRYSIYRNLDWQPILKSYSGFIVGGAAPRYTSIDVVGGNVPLRWSGYEGVKWFQGPKGDITIEGAGKQGWAPVSAFVPVLGGQEYQFAGAMQYSGVGQSHAKILWHGDVAKSDATAYLTFGRDGSGTVQLNRFFTAPPGATLAEIFLMGGWSQDVAHRAITVFSGLRMNAISRFPNVETFPTDSAQSSSIIHELPNLLPEPASTIGSPHATGIPKYTLSRWSDRSGLEKNGVFLLGYRDVTLGGVWGNTSVPGPMGLAQFTEDSVGSVLTVSGHGLNTVMPGSKVTWLEYNRGEREPSQGVVHQVALDGTNRSIEIGCTQPRCTIANILIVPPLPQAQSVARLAYGYSSVLRSSSHEAPFSLEGEWASFYSPPPKGTPSALYDSAAPIRWIGLALGHLFCVLALAVGFLERFWTAPLHKAV